VIDIFGRINSVSKSLNPMEKLNALYSGEFKQFCLNQAVARLPFWRNTNIFSANEISRMQEVQFVSDLVINFIEGLIDYNPNKIKAYYKDYDETFPQEEDLERRLEAAFQRLVALPTEDFSDTVFCADRLQPDDHPRPRAQRDAVRGQDPRGHQIGGRASFRGH
jgi:hypothetical protein